MYHILIIGQGNIGSFIGASFQSSGWNVRHYVRQPEKAKDHIICRFNDRRKTHTIKKGTTYKYSCIDNLYAVKDFDYIIVPVAHYQWKQVIQDLNPYLNYRQTLVLAGNFWDDYDWLEEHSECPFIFTFPNFGGSTVNNQLRGWLTPNFTTGFTNLLYRNRLIKFNRLLQEIGFEPAVEADIRGWLMTHFAWIAGMYTEAVEQGSFQKLTKRLTSLKHAYKIVDDYMQIVQKQGVDFMKYDEGAKSTQSHWWNALKTYIMFLVPGLAKSLDATKDLKVWSSYGNKILQTKKVHTAEIINTRNQDPKENYKPHTVEYYKPEQRDLYRPLNREYYKPPVHEVPQLSLLEEVDH